MYAIRSYYAEDPDYERKDWQNREELEGKSTRYLDQRDKRIQNTVKALTKAGQRYKMPTFQGAQAQNPKYSWNQWIQAADQMLQASNHTRRVLKGYPELDFRRMAYTTNEVLGDALTPYLHTDVKMSLQRNNFV